MLQSTTTFQPNERIVLNLRIVLPTAIEYEHKNFMENNQLFLFKCFSINYHIRVPYSFLLKIRIMCLKFFFKHLAFLRHGIYTLLPLQPKNHRPFLGLKFRIQA